LTFINVAGRIPSRPRQDGWKAVWIIILSAPARLWLRLGLKILQENKIKP